MKILAGILIINAILIIILGVRVYNGKIDFFDEILNKKAPENISNKVVAICLIEFGILILFLSILGVIVTEKILIFFAAAAVLLSVLTAAFNCNSLP